MKMLNILVIPILGIALYPSLRGAPEKKHKSACSNDMVILTCKKSCQDIGDPTWLKKEILRDTSDKRYSMKSFGEHYQMFLFNASVNDSGDYDCRVRTPNITRSEITTLDVKGEEECRITKEKHDAYHSVKQYLDTFKTDIDNFKTYFMPALYVMLVLNLLIIIPQWLKNKMSDICKSGIEKLSTFVYKRDDHEPKRHVQVTDAEDEDLLTNLDTSSQTQHARHTEIEMGTVDGNKESLPSSTLVSPEADEVSSLAQNPSEFSSG